MKRSALLHLLSEPLSGSARRRIKRVRQALLNSRTVRVFLTSTEHGSANGDGSRRSDSLGERLAYALPQQRFLQEARILQLASRQTQRELGLTLFASLYWLETRGLQLRMPLPLRSNLYRRWWQQHGPPHYRNADQQLLEMEERMPSASTAVAFSERPFGVNLIGHAFSVFGLGEYLRMTARAIEAAGIPCCVIEVPVDNGAPTTDRSLAGKTLDAGAEGPFAFNLFCMTADTQLKLALEQGLAQYEQRYSLVVWFWELQRWPERLLVALLLADEFWPCSRLVEQSLLGAQEKLSRQAAESTPSSTPMVRMPPVVDLRLQDGVPSREDKARARHSFGLPADAVLFAFGFDLNSMIARKNPQAVLRAFQMAFAEPDEGDAPVGLVIKSFPPRRPEPLWDQLKDSASADPRITIIEADLDREGILSLYGCCDAFVSLHRSEGLGIGLAEALQLGLDVIATDYGGNTDFCHGPLAHPISYRLIPVREGEYPHYEGMEWADPDLAHAARVMGDVAEQRHQSPTTHEETMASYRRRFSAETVGARYRQRLEELWQERSSIQQQLDSLSGFPAEPTSNLQGPQLR